MNKLLTLSALCISLFSMAARAENVIRVPAPIVKSTSSVVTPPVEQWLPGDPVYSAWENSGELYECGTAIPDASGISARLSFTQTYSGCHQDQIRTAQATLKNSLTGEIKNDGIPTNEYQTIGGISGTRTTQGSHQSGTIRYAIAPGAVSGLGAGYYRQNGGGYNFGTSMQKTAGGHQTYLSAVLYQGQYSIQFGVSTGNGMNANDETKHDSSIISLYVKPYRGVRLLRANGSIVSAFMLTSTSDVRNYYIKSKTITAAEYSTIYNNIGQVVTIELFE